MGLNDTRGGVAKRVASVVVERGLEGFDAVEKGRDSGMGLVLVLKVVFLSGKVIVGVRFGVVLSSGNRVGLELRLREE